MFEEMTHAIQTDTISRLLRIDVGRKVERKAVARVTGTNANAAQPAAPHKRTKAKIGPNDPCPCGSGKKYKFCHGAQGSQS